MPVDITDKYIRIRMRDLGQFVLDSFRTTELSKEQGLSAVMGRLKSDPNGRMVIQTYLFYPIKWSLDKARRWVEEHKAAPCRSECPMVCAIATNPIGRAIGLAVKGEKEDGRLLPVEAVIMPGSGQITITGLVGQVMEEAARVAISLIRSRTQEDLSRMDFHIHIPEGGVQKDGPSAGLAMFLALYSAINKKPLPQIAVTGEIDLSGKLLRVGGIRGKVEAAYQAGLAGVILPEANLLDLPGDIPIPIQFAETVDQALVILSEAKDLSFTKQSIKEEQNVDRLKVIQAAGLEETASDEAILAGIETMKKSLEEKEKLLASGPKPEETQALQVKIALLETSLKTLEEREKKSRIDSLVARGLEEGRLTKATEPKFRTLAEKNFEDAEKFLVEMPVLIPRDRLLHLKGGPQNQEESPVFGDGSRPIDQERLALHNKAKGYMKEKGEKNYIAALRAVGG